jgi:hypothetical protein
MSIAAILAAAFIAFTPVFIHQSSAMSGMSVPRRGCCVS